jgi:exonuclease SbcD
MEGFSGSFGAHTIQWLGDNVYEIEIKGQRARLGLLPYPSERRLGEVLEASDDETLKQASYSKRLGHIFSKMDGHFDPQALNIAVSHIFVMGGQTTESERPIQIGGTLVVDPGDLPQNADYVALGHLHRAQSVKHAPVPTRYSGSPLQYSRSERAYSKSVHILEKTPETLEIEEVMLSLKKPIEVWRCQGVAEAFEKCEAEQERNVWVYLEIVTKEVIAQSDIKALKELRPDLLSIMPIIEKKEQVTNAPEEEKSFEHLFCAYYEQSRGTQASKDVLMLLSSILNEEVDDETDTADNQWIEQLYRETDD